MPSGVLLIVIVVVLVVSSAKLMLNYFKLVCCAYKQKVHITFSIYCSLINSQEHISHLNCFLLFSDRPHHSIKKDEVNKFDRYKKQKTDTLGSYVQYSNVSVKLCCDVYMYFMRRLADTHSVDHGVFLSIHNDLNV